MIPLPQPDNRLYLGRGGTGKTWLALEHAARFSRRVIVSPIDDQAPRMGCDVVIADPAELVRAMMKPTFAIAFTPGELYEDGWQWANEAAWRAGDTLIVWDECGEYMQANRLKGWARSLWMGGRHRRCRVFGTSQRPASVSRDCTANLSRGVIFHTTEPNDLRFYRGMIFDRDASEAIPRLDYVGHEAIDWTPAGWRRRRSPFA